MLFWDLTAHLVGRLFRGLTAPSDSIQSISSRLPERGVPVARWCKRWPADLVVPDSSTAWGRDIFDGKRDSTAHSHSIEKDVESRYPSIHPREREVFCSHAGTIT